MTDARRAGIRVHGYRPGVVGRITEAHAVYYAEEWGLDASFEIEVAAELAAFVRGFRPERHGLWVASAGEEHVGSVAIDDGPTEVDGARLRWFLVRPAYQGRGIGKELLTRAVSFCRDRGHGRLHLWTFSGLDRARSLYERHGFRLCREKDSHRWGRPLREQQFELRLAPPGTTE